MTYLHDPNATLDYLWDWQLWMPQGDHIDTYQLIVSPGLEVVQHSRQNYHVTAFLRITGTVPTGTTLYATCRITTLNVPARVEDRTIELVVGPR